jgi:hypothetical protein
MSRLMTGVLGDESKSRCWAGACDDPAPITTTLADRLLPDATRQTMHPT